MSKICLDDSPHLSPRVWRTSSAMMHVVMAPRWLSCDPVFPLVAVVKFWMHPPKLKNRNPTLSLAQLKP
eukprot:5549081-Amphidinium_carterae.1